MCQQSPEGFDELTQHQPFRTEDKVMSLLLASQLGIVLGHMRDDMLRQQRIANLEEAIRAPAKFCAVAQGSLDPETLSVLSVVEKMERVLSDVLGSPYVKVFFLEHHEHHARPRGHTVPLGAMNRLWYGRGDRQRHVP